MSTNLITISCYKDRDNVCPYFPPHIIRSECHWTLIFLMVCSGKKENQAEASVWIVMLCGQEVPPSPSCVLPERLQVAFIVQRAPCFSEVTVSCCWEGVLPSSLNPFSRRHLGCPRTQVSFTFSEFWKKPFLGSLVLSSATFIDV